MSLSNLNNCNFEQLHIQTLYSNTIDSICGNDDLAIGATGASGIWIGGASTPVYINNHLFTGETGATGIQGATGPTGATGAPTTVGSFGSTPNSGGASITGSVLTLQPASIGFGGGVSTVYQGFTGLKDFSSAGIELTSSANLGVASGILNNYAYYTVSMTWAGAVSGTSNLVLERIGNQLFMTAGLIYNMTQVADTIRSTAIPTIFRPNSNQYCQCLVINAASATGYQIGSCKLDTSGIITFGLGLDANTSTGDFVSMSNFSSGQSTGYGNGIVDNQTINFNLSS